VFIRGSIPARFSLLISPRKKIANQSQWPLCLQRRRAKTKPIKPNFWLSRVPAAKAGTAVWLARRKDLFVQIALHDAGAK
jgi:hypothetical protein